VFCAPPPPKGGGGTPHIVLDNPVNCRANTCMREDHLGIGGGPPPQPKAIVTRDSSSIKTQKTPKSPKHLAPPLPRGGGPPPAPWGYRERIGREAWATNHQKGFVWCHKLSEGKRGAPPPGNSHPGTRPSDPSLRSPSITNASPNWHHQIRRGPSPPKDPRWRNGPETPPLSPPAQPRPGGCGGGEGGREACFPPPSPSRHTQTP
jgi:hypothetical protein